MTEVNKGNATHQRLISLLSEQGATYRVVSHEAVGKCEAVSEIRGTALGQGAKALVCKVKATALISMCWQFCPLTSRPISVC